MVFLPDDQVYDETNVPAHNKEKEVITDYKQ
jgi:hypothetical protein